MKNKRVLLSFLALYSMTAAYAETNVKVNSKLDKIYNNLISDKGVSEKDYGFLEEVLNKRNKELKDLYEQSDYIVKPEYLEWQIFFTGFYDHIERGDNTKANAKYHSDPTYNESGIQGKVMQGTQVSKEVDLGIRIPMKEVSRTPLNLEILPPATVNINPIGEITVSLPQISVPKIEVPSFQLVDVSVVNMNVNKVVVPAIKVTGSGNTDAQAILNFGTSTSTYMDGGDDTYNNGIITQQNLTGGSLDVTLDSSNLYDAGISNTSAFGKTHLTSKNYGILTGSWENISRSYVMKLVGGNSGQTLEIDDVDITYTGLYDKVDNRFLFFTDSHNKNSDNLWNITDKTNITLKGQNTIMFGVQYHGTTTDTTAGNSGMINNGIILADNTPAAGTTPGNRIIFTTIESFPNKGAGSYGNDNRKLYFTNNNLVEVDGINDVIGNFASPANQIVTGQSGGGTIFTNDGTMKVNGLNALGIVIQDKGAESIITNFSQSAVLFNNPLELLGDNSIGFYSKNSAFANNMALSKLNITIGNEANKIVSSGNKSGGDAGFVEGATAIYTDRAIFTVNASNGSGTGAGTHNLLFGNYAKESSLIRADGGKITVTGVLEVNAGKYNVGIISAGLADDAGTAITNSGEIILASGATLKVSGDDTKNAAAYAQDEGIFTNEGTIEVTNAGTNGVITSKNIKKGNIINNGTITKENNGAAVVLAGGDFSSTGSIITKNGSAGIFANKDVSANEVVISGQGVTADNGGIAFYAGAITGSLPTEGHITFRGLNSSVTTATIKNGGLMFYNDYTSTNGAAGSGYGQFTISGPTTINIENGGTVFGFKSAAPTSDDFTNYLTNTFGSSISNLKIVMPTGGAGTGNLFVLDHSTLDLTGIKNAVDVINSGSSLTVTGNSRFALLTDSVLNIDNNAAVGNAGSAYDLDDKDNLINQVSAVNSLINITANTYIKGTQDNQVFIKQVNKASQAQNAIAITNAGNINMYGTGSVSLYSVYGDIKNTGIITTSNGAIGILGLNETKIENASSGIMNVGNYGIGIAGLTYNGQDSAALKYGYDKVDISNNGVIKDTTAAGLSSGL